MPTIRGSLDGSPEVDSGASLRVEKEEPAEIPAEAEGALPEVKIEKEDEAKPEFEPTHRARDLQEDAKSLKHKLTHLPKNPYCQACQEAKMKQAYSRRGAFQRPTEHFGQLISFDHMFSAQARMVGLNGELHAFNIKDLYTGFIMSYPVQSRSAEECVKSIRHFLGGHRVVNV